MAMYSTGDHCADIQVLRNLPWVNVLPFVINHYAAWNHAQLGETRKAVDQAFCDFIIKVLGVRIGRVIDERQHGYRLNSSPFSPFTPPAEISYSGDRQQHGGEGETKGGYAALEASEQPAWFRSVASCVGGRCASLRVDLIWYIRLSVALAYLRTRLRTIGLCNRENETIA